MTDEEPKAPDLLTPQAASRLYAEHGITRGRSVQTLARMRSGQSAFAGPEYIRVDGLVFYCSESVVKDITRILGLPSFTSVKEEKAAGRDVPNGGRAYGRRAEATA